MVKRFRSLFGVKIVTNDSRLEELIYQEAQNHIVAFILHIKQEIVQVNNENTR